MHPVQTGAKGKRTVLVLVMALGVGLPPPARAFLLDVTVSSINPAVLSSYAGHYPWVPSPLESNLTRIDVSLTGDLKLQPSPAATSPGKNLHFPTGPLVYHGANVPAPASAGAAGGISPQGAITLQGDISGLNLSGGTTLWRGSFGAGSVTEPAPVRGNAFFSVAGSNFTDNNDAAWLAALDLYRQTANDNVDPGCAASFASIPRAFPSTMVPRGKILNHLVPFSNTLLLLGSGLMGLVGLRYRRRRR
jgi:hypothetical protein